MPLPTRNSRALSLKDITNVAIRFLLGTQCMTKAVLAIGTTATMIGTVVGSISYILDGKYFTKTGTAVLFDLTSAGVLANRVSLAANQFTTFLCGFDASGNPIVVQGPVVTAAADMTLPDIPTDAAGVPTFCPVGYVKVASGAAAYVPGTTALTGLGTYVDCAVLPAGAL